MPHKLGFHITNFTSEEDNAKAKDLLQQGPGVRGWVSGKFPIYPQELILQLDNRSHLSRVQVLAHQHLIPEKIELFIGDVPPGKEISVFNAKFAQLGYVTLSNNDHTQFKARELKSVTVDCTGTFLKLVLHKNHNNKLNRFNQISLVGVNVLGNEVEDNNNSVSPDGEGGQVPSAPRPDLPGGALPPHHDLAFSMYVDSEVATTIHHLEDRKTAAFRAKRYEYANRIKATVLLLRTAGERLGKLEIEKRHAIDNENFERAKLKKQIQEEYRDLVYKLLQVDDLLEASGKQLEKNDAPHQDLPELPPCPRPKSQTPSSGGLPPARPGNTPPGPPPTPPKSPSPPPLKTPSKPLPNLRSSGGSTTPTPRPYPSSPRVPEPATYTSPQTPSHSAYTAYDERTLPALKQ